jgi:hypothetical protein
MSNPNLYYQIMGQTIGPISSSELRQLVQLGTVTPETQIRKGVDGSWFAASLAKGLFDPYAQTAAGSEGLYTAQMVADPNQPPPPPPPPSLITRGDATGGIIPYKNPHALAAYYLGIVGLIPVIGFFLAIAAIFLGFSGIKKRRLDPIIKGTAHAIIGIVLGFISIGYHVLIGLFLLSMPGLRIDFM